MTSTDIAGDDERQAHHPPDLADDTPTSRLEAEALARRIAEYWLMLGMTIEVRVEQTAGEWVVRSDLRHGFPTPAAALR
jgi:hypothetical protein